jgi:hypothetical protein
VAARKVGGVPQKFIKISYAKVAVIELISGKFRIIRSPFLGEGGQHGARDLVYRVELRCHDNETFHQTILGRRNVRAPTFIGYVVNEILTRLDSFYKIKASDLKNLILLFLL